MTQRPNVLIVHWHDLGRHLACYGAANVTSPALDALAAEGTLYEQAYCTTPLCSPARGSLFTGRYHHAHGIMGLTHRGWEYHPGEQRLPELLRPVGYHCALVGLQHESRDSSSLGYDEVIDRRGSGSEFGHYCGPVTDAAIDWLATAPTGRPWMLTVGFIETHRPYPLDRYEPDDASKVVVPGFLPDNEWTRDDLAMFQGSIRRADRDTGRLLAALDSLPLGRETWVIFTTDHGMAFPRAKSSLYDPGIEVALIQRFPQSWGPLPRRHSHLYSHVDLAPTILDRIGAPMPASIQGISHAAWFTDASAHPRSAAFAGKTYQDCYDPMRCIRTDRWKYIKSFEERPILALPPGIERSPTRHGYGDDHLRHRPMRELYDLAVDPLEQRNLAEHEAYRSVSETLDDRLLEWQKETGDPLLHGPIPDRSDPKPLPAHRARAAAEPTS